MAQSQLSAVETVGFELSAQQKRLWRLGHAESCRAIGVVRVDGEIDRARLDKALERVVERYEVLRTTLHVDAAHRYPLQVVGHEPQINVRVDDALLRFELPGMFGDFVSLKNICAALAREYDGAEIEADVVQYVDYAGWQQTLLEQPDTAEALAYWHVRNRRSFATELLDAGAGATSFDNEPESRVPDGLDRTSLLAAWFVLLWRLTGEVPVIGVEFDGRTFPELHQTVGLFARWLPMQLELNSRLTFAEVVKQAAVHEEKARRWQDYFELEAPAESRFAAGFEFRDLRRDSIFSLVDYDVSYEPCELKLICTLRDSGCHWNIKASDSRIRDCFAQLIQANPETRIDQIPILTRAMRRRVLVEWNQTAREFPTCANVPELFESAVARNATNEALAFAGRSWTFDELNRRANQLAHHLRRAGAGPEQVVGLCLEHSDELVMAAIAIMKSGAAFMPLNPVLPTERLRSLAHSTSVAAVVTTAGLATLFDDVAIVDIHAPEIANENDANPTPLSTSDNLAYVMYTSGSTGGPKGVMIEHRSLLNLAFALDDAVYTRASQTRCVSLNGPLSFDTSIKQLVQLCFGRKLCVVPPELRNTPPEFVEFIARNEIDVLDSTPSHLRLLIDAGLRGPSLVLVGGEEFDRQTWEYAAQSETMFVNVYGPTECTVDATACHVKDAKAPSLGRPLANVRTYILDHNGAPVPPGVIGELHIAGAGVGRGYFNAPDLTAAHFIPDPFSATPGARLYKTGDFARHLADGAIEYHGRRDDQVKIRGSRVELNEVAEAVARHPAVEQAVVLPNDEILIAYIVFQRGARAGANELRKFLLSTLPDFMTPARFVEVKSIPLTTAGKVDRRLLASLAETALDEGVVQEPPRTPTEETTAAIWGEVLNQKTIGRDVNFFELGGYSLLALRAIARLRHAFDFDLPVRAFFDNPTVASLSAVIDRVRGVEQPASNNGLRRIEFQTAERNLSPAQEGLYFLSQLRPRDASYNILLAIRLQGELSVPALKQSLETIIQRHEPLRTTFSLIDGVPKAILTDEANVDLQTIELTYEQVYEWAAAEAKVPFDVSQYPLHRFQLIKLGPREHALIFVTHHLVFDGPSTPIFLRELAELYGGSNQLPELAISYSDYVEWQRSADLQNELDYWRENLKDAPTDLAWPEQKGSSDPARVEQGFEQWVLSPELTQQLNSACRREQVTPYVMFLTAYVACLHRWARHSDLVVTSPYAARTHTALESLIGFFINNLVLRLRMPQDATYQSLLPVVRDAVLGAMAHQDAPLSRVLDAAGTRSRNGGARAQTPFNQVRFDFQEHGTRSYELPNLTMTLETSDTFMVRYDLFLFVRAINGSYTISLGYDASLFEPHTITRLMSSLQTVVTELITKPETPIRINSFAGLLNVKPKLMRLPDSESLVNETFLDPERPWPLVIEARHNRTNLVNWCERNRELIRRKLLTHSGILFRNFDIDGVEEFEKFVAAFDQELIPYQERSTPRTRISGNIYTSTEYSADQSIPLHSESSYAHCWPMKIWFFCVEPSATGGQTTTADNREVFKRLDPALRARMTKTSVMYVRNYHPRIDLPWTEVFQTTDRSEVEAYCRKHLIGYKWLGGERLQTIQVRQAVAQHPRTGEWVWFNQSHLFHINNLPPAIREVLQQSLDERDWPRNSYYGDGTPIESETLDQIAAAYRECAVPIDWRRGDVLMLDNMLASHGREPFTGDRRIAVAMAEPFSLNSYC